METASLRGRRRRNLPNEDEEESLDDLLKTVDSKPVAEEASKGKKAGNETEDSGSSRRESVTKLPTGRQIKQQVVCNSLFVHFVVVLLKASNFSPLYRNLWLPFSKISFIYFIYKSIRHIKDCKNTIEQNFKILYIYRID